jgi:diguanylate cyclase (GGDEF)-like protein
MDTPRTTKHGIGIIGWLAGGAAAVVLVLLTGNQLIEERAQTSATRILAIHAAAEPIVRGSAALDAAVGDLADVVAGALQTTTLQGGAGDGLDAARGRLEAARTDLGRARLSGELTATLDALPADAATLLRMDLERRNALASYTRAINRMRDRVTRAGGAGIWVGDQNVGRRSLSDMATAISDLQAAAMLAASASNDLSSTSLTRAEGRVQAAMRLHETELSRSPGSAWLELMRDDLSRAGAARRGALARLAEIQEANAAFLSRVAEAESRIHAELTEPARREIAEGVQRAQAIAAEAQESVRKVSLSVLAVVLGVFVLTAAGIVAPVRRLREGTRRLAVGDLAARVTPGGPAEIDELARSFNHMADALGKAEAQLKAEHAMLEDRVVERTAQLRHLAMHDPLTGLPNRRHLYDELNAAIEVASGTGSHVALLVIDLDDFKTSNDSLGHAFGDLVLKAVAEHLRREFGREALIARLGGDEFTISKTHVRDQAEIERLAERVIASFQRPLQIGDRELVISASVGHAQAPEHGSDTESLLQSADAALFRAKALGRNRHHGFSPSLLAASDRKFRTEQALRRAVGDDALLLHFQPELSLARGRVTVAEALLRWRRPDGSIATAGEFIGYAAETDLLTQLNLWALDAALSTVARQRAQGWPDMRVAVNVSSRQFMLADFIGRVERALRYHDLAPECLEIELTEDVLQTGRGTTESLQSLRGMGVTIALDDFGAGFSSLASVERLPLSRIKFDRSLIASIDENERSAAIVTSMVRLCHDLGLAVTAEGVERPSQLALLSSLGGVDVQGYLIARPAPIHQLVEELPQLRDRLNPLLAQSQAELFRGDADRDDAVTRLRSAVERQTRR